MMMAAGCIQAQECHTNKCPVGVATQNPRRARALDVPDKTERVQRYQQATVAEAQRIIASMGLAGPERAAPRRCCIAGSTTTTTRTYAELYDWLEPGQLLDRARRADWAADWAAASADSFR